MAQLCQHILEMQKVYDQTVSPANIAKMLLSELRGCNPFNLLKRPFVFPGQSGCFVLLSSCNYSLVWSIAGTRP